MRADGILHRVILSGRYKPNETPCARRGSNPARNKVSNMAPSAARRDFRPTVCWARRSRRRRPSAFAHAFVERAFPQTRDKADLEHRAKATADELSSNADTRSVGVLRQVRIASRDRGIEDAENSWPVPFVRLSCD
jgi:hypothetical protein